MSTLMRFMRFSGRTGWPGYWQIVRFPVIVIPAAVAFLWALAAIGVLKWSFTIIFTMPLVHVLAALLLSPFWIAATARRLHDTGRSARWLLVLLVIAIGWAGIGMLAAVIMRLAYDEPSGGAGLGALWLSVVLGLFWSLASQAGGVCLFVQCTFSGTVGPNRYGPDPLCPEPGDGV